MVRSIGIAAAAFGATAVMLGAFGAHALRGRIDEAALLIWHTAVEYQFWHALALLALGMVAHASSPAVRPDLVEGRLDATSANSLCTHGRRATRSARASAIAFTAGIVLFSGSLYALALGAPHWIGAITPFGGVALIAGWTLLGCACCTATRK